MTRAIVLASPVVEDLVCPAASSVVPAPNDDSDEEENDQPPIITSPVMPEDYEGPEPCDQLNDLLDPNKANIKPTIQALQQSIGQQGEDGASFKKDSNGYGIDQLNATQIRSIPIPTGHDDPAIYGAAHTHPLSTYPMFSFSDLFVLLNLYSNANISNKKEVVFMLVCKNDEGMDQVYALKINDFNTFRAMMYTELNAVANSSLFLNQSSPLSDLINEVDNNILKKDYISAANASTWGYETAFLNFFQDYNVSLFKANSTLDSWVHLFEIDIESNLPIELPCEN